MKEKLRGKEQMEHSKKVVHVFVVSMHIEGMDTPGLTSPLQKVTQLAFYYHS